MMNLQEEQKTVEMLEGSEIKGVEGQDPSKFVSITEAAKINNVTRQAIYVAIKQKKLKASKGSTRWTIHLDDLEAYRSNKYSRSKSTYEGELIFDNFQGYYSVNQVAKMLNVPVQKIYYATRQGMLKAFRKGAAWVIHIDDVENYRKNHLESKSQRRHKAAM
jgi:excisionase family DNA binding protein